MNIQQMSTTELRMYAKKRAEQIMIASEMSRSSSYEDAVEGDRRLAELGIGASQAKPKPAPYVCMKDRPEVVELGKEYDEILSIRAEKAKLETRLRYLEKLKTMTPAQNAEFIEKMGAAEEYESILDAFFARYPDGYVGKPELVAARRAFLQKQKEA